MPERSKYVKRSQTDGSDIHVNDMGGGYVQIVVNNSQAGHCDVSLTEETWRRIFADFEWVTTP